MSKYNAILATQNYVREQLNDFSGGDDTTISAINDKLTELETRLNDATYKKISIDSFTNNAGTKEMGAIVSEITLSWKTNKTPNTLTLDGESIDVSTTSKKITGLSITCNDIQNWTLTATDERNASVSKTTSISFANGVYYGVAEKPTAYDSDFILGLSKRELTNNKVSSISVNASAGQYIYYCLPVRMGNCIFKIGGLLPGGFNLVGEIDFTNSSNYVEKYYIYESVNPNLGQTNINIE